MAFRQRFIRYTVAGILLGILLLIISPEPAAAQGKPCAKAYTRTDYTKYARYSIHGTHLPSKGQRAFLGTIGRCQYRQSAIPSLRKYRDRLTYRVVWNRNLTNDVTSGGTSWFGGEQTADGGNADRPCIALRDTSTLGVYFLVTVWDGFPHRAVLLHCDSGPYVAGRSIDITPLGLDELGFYDHGGYCNCYGEARRLHHYMRMP